MCLGRPLSSSVLFLFVSFSQCFLVSFLYYFTFMSDEKAWSLPVSLLGLTGPLLVRMLLDGAELCDPLC